MRYVQFCLSDSKNEHLNNSVIIIIIIVIIIIIITTTTIIIDVCYATDFWWGNLKERNTWYNKL